MESANNQAIAKIILVTNQKGGSGKTTTAVNIAAGLHQKGARVLIVDADLQNSVEAWFANGEGQIAFPYVNLAGAKKGITNEIQKQINLYEYIVIDGRPNISVDISALLIISDLVIVPLKPSLMDLQATKPLIHEIEKAQTLNPELKFTLLFNQLMGDNRLLVKACVDAIGQEEYGLLNTRIAHRECYPQAYALGHTIFDSNDRPYKQAKAEVTNLTEEVLGLLEGEQ